MTHHSHGNDAASLRPSRICAHLLAALDASEGRRRSRKRDTTPDAIGLAIKRGLLERAVADDPSPAEFERWLIDACERQGRVQDDAGPLPGGAIRAMAMDVLGDWRIAQQVPDFHSWLEHGAPSDDRR